MGHQLAVGPEMMGSTQGVAVKRPDHGALDVARTTRKDEAPAWWRGLSTSANVSEGATPERDPDFKRGGRPRLTHDLEHDQSPGSNPGPSTNLHEVSAYAVGCIVPGPGIPEPPAQKAANGRWPEVGVSIAADPSIPFGTELLIEGLGFRTVGDRGSAIRGRKIDVFVSSCDAARKFGRRWLHVIVVPPASARYAANNTWRMQ